MISLKDIKLLLIALMAFSSYSMADDFFDDPDFAVSPDFLKGISSIESKEDKKNNDTVKKDELINEHEELTDTTVNADMSNENEVNPKKDIIDIVPPSIKELIDTQVKETHKPQTTFKDLSQRFKRKDKPVKKDKKGKEKHKDVKDIIGSIATKNTSKKPEKSTEIAEDIKSLSIPLDGVQDKVESEEIAVPEVVVDQLNQGDNNVNAQAKDKVASEKNNIANEEAVDGVKNEAESVNEVLEEEKQEKLDNNNDDLSYQDEVNAIEGSEEQNKIKKESSKKQSPPKSLDSDVKEMNTLEKKKNSKNPQPFNTIYNREVYDYKQSVPSSQIYKKNYGPNNKHLPVARDSTSITRYLFAAVKDDDVNLTKTLLSQGANINAVDESTGYTPLMYAVTNYKDKVLSYLLVKNANINIQEDLGRTALHLSVIVNNVWAYKELLRAGGDLKVKDKNGRFATDFIKDKGLLYYFIDSFNDKDQAIIEFSKLRLLEGVKIVKSRNGNLDYIDSEGNNALFYAIENNDMKIVNFLLVNNINIDIRNKKGQDVFDKAYGKKKILVLLETYKIKKELESNHRPIAFIK